MLFKFLNALQMLFKAPFFGFSKPFANGEYLEIASSIPLLCSDNVSSNVRYS